jgi:3-hydroxyisobutyrate dehydrogenase-like beta-hydroxyacid dehydrogenase
MDVGFIGLGQMGRAIAANLLRSGHRVLVWNRSPAATRALTEQGAQPASGAADTAQAQVLMSMLADDGAHRDVIEQGQLFAHAPRGLIFVNLATISVNLCRTLAQHAARHGVEYVAAPVFGRPEVAAAGKLNVVAGGPAAVLERLQPLFSAIAQRVWPVGNEPERANAVKLAGNFMIASALETMGEAAALAQAHGVATADFLDILNSTLFAAPVYQNYGRLIAEKRYEPAGFPMALGLKDVRLALEAADAAQVPMPFAGILRDHFLEALATGRPERDWSAIAEIALRHAGLE